MSRGAHNCPRCGEWLLQPVPSGIRVKARLVIVLDDGGLVLACPKRSCQVTYRVARSGPGAYHLAPYVATTTRAARADARPS